MKKHRIIANLLLGLSVMTTPLFAINFTTPNSITATFDSMPEVTETAEAFHNNYQLTPYNWDTFNREALNQLIAKYGKDNPNYDPDHKPYAIFDWDNTSIFLDIQEAVLIYQIEHLIFKLTPAELNDILRLNVPLDNFTEKDNNLSDQPINIDQIATDIVNSYTWLYNNYKGMKGKIPLTEIKRSPEYQEFSSKLRYLYSAIGNSFDASLSYPWVTYLFSGLTQQDIAEMTVNTVEWQMQESIEDVTWVSPDIPSEAGMVSITWHNGLRLVPEMQDLYAKLRDAGIDVWICSASFVDVIKEISSNPKFGYNNPIDHVIAMELERDDNGIIQPQFRNGYQQTQGKGKTLEIERLILPLYQNRGPILIAGDSEGDQNMMQDFEDTEKVIIINRLRSPTSKIGEFSKEAAETYDSPNAKYLLQGRDENTGLYTKSQQTTPFGKAEGKLLKNTQE